MFLNIYDYFSCQTVNLETDVLTWCLRDVWAGPCSSCSRWTLLCRSESASWPAQTGCTPEHGTRYMKIMKSGLWNHFGCCLPLKLPFFIVRMPRENIFEVVQIKIPFFIRIPRKDILKVVSLYNNLFSWSEMPRKNIFEMVHFKLAFS